MVVNEYNTIGLTIIPELRTAEQITDEGTPSTDVLTPTSITGFVAHNHFADNVNEFAMIVNEIKPKDLKGKNRKEITAIVPTEGAAGDAGYYLYTKTLKLEEGVAFSEVGVTPDTNMGRPMFNIIDAQIKGNGKAAYTIIGLGDNSGPSPGTLKINAKEVTLDRNSNLEDQPITTTDSMIFQKFVVTSVKGNVIKGFLVTVGVT